MENLPVEIFDFILQHLTLADWKCLRLTSRNIYSRLSSISSYSDRRPVVLVPRSSSGLSLLDKPTSMKGIDQLVLSNFDPSELQTLLQSSESFCSFLVELRGLSFAGSTRLIDSRVFYDLLRRCQSLEKLDLSNYKFFFLSHNFSQNSSIFPSVTRLNLSHNAHLSDYIFNRLVHLFPNLTALHLLNIPLRSSLPSIENRTFLTFENVCSYFQKFSQRFEELTISFDRTLPCDVQIKRLFNEIPRRLTYFYINGNLTISTLLHFLLLFDNQLETLIVGHLILDHTGCQPLFAAISQYASHLKHLCVFLNPPMTFSISQQQKTLLPIFNLQSEISLESLANLQDLDIQTLYPLNEIDLVNLLTINGSLGKLKKLALPKNTTDDVMKSLCFKSSFARRLTHLNLNNCPSLSNRSILMINKSLVALEELSVNYNVNINDFAFIGLSICGIGKSIEWLEHTMIDRQFIEDLPIWSCNITHQASCQCRLPNFLSSSCIKLRLKDFNFDYDDYSDRILFLLTEHPLFSHYFHSINQLIALKSLKLRQCVQLTNRLFRFAFRFLPNLKSLDLNGCEKLTDKHLALIGRACPAIETIDLSNCSNITDHGRQILRENAKRLKNLEF